MNRKIQKKQTMHHFGLFMFSWCKISRRTRGVAVAVNAIKGTVGNLSRRTRNRL